MAKIPTLYAQGFEHGISEAAMWLRHEIHGLRGKQRTALIADVRLAQAKIDMLIQLVTSIEKLTPNSEDRAERIREAVNARATGAAP